MFRSHTANLPPEQRQRLHPDFLANEQAYLGMRDKLLASYPGQWVAVAGGKVLTASDDLVTVATQAALAGGHPYIARVGAEDQVVFRLRRQEFAFDATYQPFSLPRCTATFWNHAETQSQAYADVIPDTGSDLTVLPAADCPAFDLFSSPCFSTVAGGVVGGSMATLVYLGRVEINGVRHLAFIQPLTGGQERLIGRDVLNQHRVLFDGPQQRLTFDP